MIAGDRTKSDAAIGEAGTSGKRKPIYLEFHPNQIAYEREVVDKRWDSHAKKFVPIVGDKGTLKIVTERTIRLPSSKNHSHLTPYAGFVFRTTKPIGVAKKKRYDKNLDETFVTGDNENMRQVAVYPNREYKITRNKPFLDEKTGEPLLDENGKMMFSMVVDGVKTYDTETVKIKGSDLQKAFDAWKDVKKEKQRGIHGG